MSCLLTITSTKNENFLDSNSLKKSSKILVAKLKLAKILRI